jgi:hypothetical protein
MERNAGRPRLGAPEGCGIDPFVGRGAASLARTRARTLRQKLGRSDAETDRLQARLDAAEVALVATPAAYPDAVWLKFDLIENLATGDCVAGNSVYPLAILALASLKADILNGVSYCGFGAPYPDAG